MKLNLPEEATKTLIANALIWKRIAAFIIDLLILNFIVFISFGNVIEKYIPKNYSFSDMYDFLQTNPHFSDKLATVGIYSSLMALVYFIFLEQKMQQSIGKKFMNLYVVGMQNQKPSAWQHMVRNLFFIPIFPFILLWIFDPVLAIFTKNHQRLSEILSKTKVVEKHNFIINNV